MKLYFWSISVASEAPSRYLLDSSCWNGVVESSHNSRKSSFINFSMKQCPRHVGICLWSNQKFREAYCIDYCGSSTTFQQIQKYSVKLNKKQKSEIKFATEVCNEGGEFCLFSAYPIKFLYIHVITCENNSCMSEERNSKIKGLSRCSFFMYSRLLIYLLMYLHDKIIEHWMNN